MEYFGTLSFKIKESLVSKRYSEDGTSKTRIETFYQQTIFGEIKNAKNVIILKFTWSGNPLKSYEHQHHCAFIDYGMVRDKLIALKNKSTN